MTSSKVPSETSRKVNPDAQQFLTLNQQVFAELLTFVDFAEGFTLGLVDINFLSDAQILIEALKNHPQCQDIQFECFDFSQKANLRFMRDALLQQLHDIQIEADKKLVLIVLGLEKSIGVFGDYPPILQDLNFVRDAYKNSIPHPLLLILPDYAITRLAKFAPDFWAWKSGVFLFKTSRSTQEYARSKTLDSNVPIGTPEKPESSERIELLERLLMEYQPDGQHRFKTTNSSTCTCNTILHQLGLAYLSQSNTRKAQEYLEEALKETQKSQDTQLQAKVYQALGNTYASRGYIENAESVYKKAESAYECALERFRYLQDEYGGISTVFCMGKLYFAQGEFDQAQKYYQSCLDYYKKSGDRYSQANIYDYMGRVSLRLREYEQAQQYFQKALDIYIESGDRYNQAGVYYEIGIASEELQEYEQASQYYGQAYDIYSEYKDHSHQRDMYEAFVMLSLRAEDKEGL